MRVIETSYICGTWTDGVLSPAYQKLRSQLDCEDWAIDRIKEAADRGEVVTVRTFDWTAPVPHNFSGLEIETQRHMRTDEGRSRIWSMPDGMPKYENPPIKVTPPEIGRPSSSKTYYEIHIRQKGSWGITHTDEDTFGHAKETAYQKASALNLPVI